MATRLCGAKKTNGGGTCKQVAGAGTGHVGVGRCKFHGGATPTHELNGAKEMARLGIGFYGAPVQGADPGETLLEEVARTAGHVRWLHDRVSYVRDDQNDLEEDEVRHLRELYQAERDRLQRVCTAAVSSGLAERQVQLAERYGDKIAAVMQAFIADLDLTPEQEKEAPKIVKRHLVLLDGGIAA